MVTVGSYNIELIPATTWGKSLAHLARQKGSGFRSIWDKIRERELGRADRKCEICKTSASSLICHEKWQFDDAQSVQRLIGYEVTCRECSNILHLGRASEDKVLWEKAKVHFAKVTRMEENVLDDVLDQAMKEWTQRSKHNWSIDISHEPLAFGFEKKLNNLQPSSQQERKWQGIASLQL